MSGNFLIFTKFVIFYAKCTYVHYATQVFVQTMCKQRDREKKEWKKKIANGRMAESLETDRVNLIKFYDQTPQQV